MAVFKCKMCGGDLEIQPGISVAECPYCGTKQTLPNGACLNISITKRGSNCLIL